MPTLKVTSMATVSSRNADKDLLKELTKPKSRPPTAEELMAGDLNGDGKLDVKDFVLLVQMLNGP